MPSGLEGLAALYAPKKPELKKPLPDDIQAVAGEPEGVEVDLENPSAFESTLKTLGLGGYGVRNLLKGNAEGTARNLVDAISSPLRALLPGDQSDWELSREEDLPEASDLIGGMEPGWGKVGVDVAGGILTDPLSFLGVGAFSNAAKGAKAANTALKLAHGSKDAVKIAEATKAAQAANAALRVSQGAGETKTALGLAPLPFMAARAEIPGSAAALGYIGDKAGKVAGAAAGGIRKIPGGAETLEGAAKFGRATKWALGAGGPTGKAAEDIAASEGLGAATAAPKAAPMAFMSKYSPDIQKKAQLLVEDAMEGVPLPRPTATTPADDAFTGMAGEPAAMQMMITKQMRRDLSDLGHTKAEIDAMTPQAAATRLRESQGLGPDIGVQLGPQGPTAPAAKFNLFEESNGLSGLGTREQQIDLFDRRLARTGWDDATKEQVRAAAIENSDYYRNTYRQSTGDTVLERPDALWTKDGAHVPAEHVKGLYDEDIAQIDKNIAATEREMEKQGLQAIRQQAKIAELKPLHETAASNAYSAGTTADELLERLPDLANRKKNMDALELKLSRLSGAANTLGSLVKGSGAHNQQLFQKILDNKYSIEQAKEAMAALRKAHTGTIDPIQLGDLQFQLKESIAVQTHHLGELMQAAKAGEFGEALTAHQAWTAARSDASAAAYDLRQAKKAGQNPAEIAEMKKVYAAKKAEAEGALQRLRTLRPKLTESNRTDNILTGRLATKQGQIRELRQLMNQLDDADLSRVGSMTQTAYRAKGKEQAFTKSAERAYSRLQRAEGKLANVNEMRPGLEGLLTDLKNKPTLDDWATTSGGYQKSAMADDVAPLDFAPRQWEMDELEQLTTHEQRGAALASMLKSRTLTDKKAFVDKLNTPGTTLKGDLGLLGANYGQQLGEATRKADLAKRTIGEFKKGATAAEDTGFKSLVDAPSRQRMNSAIESLRKAGDHDNAHALDVAFNGLPPPKGIWRVIASINKPFKAAATAGIVVPRMSFTVGNSVSNVVQFLQNQESRGIALKQLLKLPKIIAGSIADGLKRLGVKSLPESHFDELAEAAAKSDGTREGMLGLVKDKNLKMALENNVLDGGFVTAEQMGTDFATKGDPKNWRNWAYWGQDIAKGTEQRMRYYGFVDLVEAGETPADAARIVNGSLFNYKFTSVGNRNLRQIFPFGMYTMKAVPQAAKFIAEKPAMAAGLNALYSQNDANENPLPPWTQGNINIPLGPGETGNPQYLTSLRMPFETLAKLPNPSGDLGDILSDTRQDIGGQLSPLIKTGLGAFGGNDPRTGQPFMSNDRAPALLSGLGLLDERGEGARIYNALASTGVPQPITSPIAVLSKFFDKRQSLPIASLNALTGLTIIDVDEQQAMRQLLEDAIRRDPSIKAGANYYQLSKSPEGQALLQKLQDVRREISAKKKAAAP